MREVGGEEAEGENAERGQDRIISVDSKTGYLVRRLVVDVGKVVSSHRHLHRLEHWVVVSGVVKINFEDEEVVLRKGESAQVSAGDVHELENVGKIPLEIIEVWMGEYLGEDDCEKIVSDESFVFPSSEEFCIGPGC